ncbi:SagB family peptide dehydrogenase [Streptomyces sp. NBC_01136]|uniref:SagB family peptide dehydrogenase n=1 Tax=unclassified Streptomyces TaxID=2593676 RepID=UPI00324B060D|nr:SagB family peptide dehydrogenase [Streptomyces sp. NBC_01136]
MTETFALLPDAELQIGADGQVTVHNQLRGSVLGKLTAGQLAVLDALASGVRTMDDLTALGTGLDGWAGGLRHTHQLLDGLRRHHWVQTTLWDGDRRIMTVRPHLAPLPKPSVPIVAELSPAADSLVLSRYVLLRRDGAVLVLESTITGTVVELYDDWLLTLLAAPLSPLRVGEITAAVAWAESALATLLEHGLLEPEGAEAEAETAAAGWTAHELWFHSRSSGEPTMPNRAGLGLKTRAVRDGEPADIGPAIPLAVPDLARRRAQDPTLTDVLERRRSVRVHDDTAPLTAAQLGEFLFRTVRTRRTWTQNGVELADRPYPSSGALHELEHYLVITNVAGLPPGLYRYDGRDHALQPAAANGPAVGRLADRAARAAVMTTRPQALLIMGARLGRLSWKYPSMAYALALRDTGVVYATMYLVATAMGLAPCALGTGDPVTLARATGLDPRTEAGVGRFLLGSLPRHGNETRAAEAR